MTCHMNSKRVRDEITYQKFYGDKESYWLSSALTSTPYHFVPGYSGTIGRITHPDNSVDIEQICSLQLLHLLESTGEPLWFNNAITEFKGANDVHYIVAEGWIGHNARWHGGATRFRNEFCAIMPQGERDRTMALPEPVIRVQGALKQQIERIVQEAAKYDVLMMEAKLISI